MFALYMFTRDANAAAAMTTAIDALRLRADLHTRLVLPEKRSSVTSFAINAAKFVPSLMAMDPISFATSCYPATLLVLNTAVAIMLLVRKRARLLARFRSNSMGSTRSREKAVFGLSRARENASMVRAIYCVRPATYVTAITAPWDKICHGRNTRCCALEGVGVSDRRGRRPPPYRGERHAGGKEAAGVSRADQICQAERGVGVRP